MRRLRSLALLALLAGCARGNAPAGCAPAEASLENASRLAVEQLYLAPAGGTWGADLIGPAFPAGGDLASGARLPLRFEGRGPYALRVVWVNGRAADMQGLDGCVIRRVILLDGALRAE